MQLQQQQQPVLCPPEKRKRVYDDAAAAAAAADAAPVVHQELLYPPRHRITLPLNNLNFIFDNIEVAFNQKSKWTADK